MTHSLNSRIIPFEFKIRGPRPLSSPLRRPWTWGIVFGAYEG